jgi:hypothetical protein
MAWLQRMAWVGEGSIEMNASGRGLLRAFERRLARLADQQRALAIERARLREQITSLRLRMLALGRAPVRRRGSGFAPGRLRIRRPARRGSPPGVVLGVVPPCPAAAPAGDGAPVLQGSPIFPIPINRARSARGDLVCVSGSPRRLPWRP